MKADLLRVTTTTPDLASAKELAHSAVGQRLAGNAQIIGPVVSVFRQLSDTDEGEEYQLVLATTNIALPSLVRHLTENHPLENAEVTAVPLSYATDVYSTWLHEATVED
jgi:periplasmic divalent cation tolerance protein